VDVLQASSIDFLFLYDGWPLGIFLLAGIVFFFIFFRKNSRKTPIETTGMEAWKQRISEASLRDSESFVSDENKYSEPINTQLKEKILPAESAVIHTQGFDGDDPQRDIGVESSELLIEFLELKTGKVEIKSETFDLNNVLNELIGALAAEYEKTGIELAIDVEHHVPRHFVGDSYRLGRILFCILKSAIEKDIQGEFLLHIATLKNKDGKEDLVFEVEYDSGEKRENFDDFGEQGKGRHGALKLFVAKEFAIKMGGMLSRKEILPGKTFYFSFPKTLYLSQ